LTKGIAGVQYITIAKYLPGLSVITPNAPQGRKESQRRKEAPQDGKEAQQRLSGNAAAIEPQNQTTQSTLDVI